MWIAWNALKFLELTCAHAWKDWRLRNRWTMMTGDVKPLPARSIAGSIMSNDTLWRVHRQFEHLNSTLCTLGSLLRLRLNFRHSGR